MTPYYDEGGITIYHGDCREVLAMGIPVCDALVTDPPYGVEFAGKKTKHTNAAGGYEGGDSLLGPQIVTMLLAHVKRAAVFTGTRLLHAYPPPADIGCVYCPSGAGRGPWGFTLFNPILFYGTNPTNHLGQQPSSIESFDRADVNGHPCPKPLRWMRWAVGMASLEGETVLDPFAGSGTTLRAAKDLGRRAIGIEVEEKYCEIAARTVAQEVLAL